MEIKFSDNEERELLSNPRAWAEKQERQKEFERDDARIDCQQKLEDINYHYYYKFIEAHNKLIAAGVIKSGDPSPWLLPA